MNRDLPNTGDLLRAAAAAMKSDILPNLAPEKHLDGLMILSIISAAERDLADAGGLDARQSERLSSLMPAGGSVADLCEAIRSGAFDGPEEFRQLQSVLLEDTRDRLALVNPKYLAAAEADGAEFTGG